MEIAIIANCTKSKLGIKAPAEELNTGQTFQMIRKIAKLTNCELWVLSGQHGLINGKTIIDPYDHKLKNNEINHVSIQVHSELKELMNKFDRIIVVVSNCYFETLKPIVNVNPEKFLRIYSQKGIFGYNSYFYHLRQLPISNIFEIFSKSGTIYV